MNVAARVQGAAGPDEVLLTEPTLRLLDDQFTIELRGSHELKGLTEPVRLYRAVAEETDRRTPGAAPRDSGPFVGRSHELAQGCSTRGGPCPSVTGRSSGSSASPAWASRG